MDELRRDGVSLPSSNPPCSVLTSGIWPDMKDEDFSNFGEHENHLGILVKMQMLIQ